MRKLTQKEIIERFKKVHGERYDYSLVKYVNINTKVKIICKKHGIFEMSPHNHLNSQNCPKCSKQSKTKTNEQFIKEANEKHNFKYDYSKINYINNCTKVEIICKEHGSFYQEPRQHLSGGGGCPKCAMLYVSKLHADKYRKTNEQFIEEAKKVHSQQYDYSKINYINSNTKIVIICKKHGLFYQTPQHHLEGNGCPKCRSSKGETKIRKFLKEKNIPFEEQKKFTNCKDNKELPFDFFIPSLNILIEYQGEQHYKNSYKEESHDWHKYRHHDWLKRNFARKNNYNLIIIPYWEFNKIENILNDLFAS